MALKSPERRVLGSMKDDGGIELPVVVRRRLYALLNDPLDNVNPWFNCVSKPPNRVWQCRGRPDRPE